MLKEWLYLVILLLPFDLYTGIQPGSTRVIYPADKKEVTFKIANNADTPRLVQAWIDRGNVDTHNNASDAPFLVVPPIFRIDPEKSQTLRMMFLGGDGRRIANRCSGSISWNCNPPLQAKKPETIMSCSFPFAPG